MRGCQSNDTVNGGVANGSISVSGSVVQSFADRPIAQQSGTFGTRTGLLAKWDASGYRSALERVHPKRKRA